MSEIHMFYYRSIELPTWMKNGQLSKIGYHFKLLGPGKLPYYEEACLKNMQELNGSWGVLSYEPFIGSGDAVIFADSNDWKQQF